MPHPEAPPGVIGERTTRHLAETVALRAALSELESMRHSGEIAGSLHKELRDRITGRLETQEELVAELTRNDDAVRERQVLMSARRLAAVQKRALSEASRSGRISDDVARRLARDIDTEVEDAPRTPAREPGDAGEADPSSGDEEG